MNEKWTYLSNEYRALLSDSIPHAESCLKSTEVGEMMVCEAILDDDDNWVVVSRRLGDERMRGRQGDGGETLPASAYEYAFAMLGVQYELCTR